MLILETRALAPITQKGKTMKNLVATMKTYQTTIAVSIASYLLLIVVLADTPTILFPFLGLFTALIIMECISNRELN